MNHAEITAWLRETDADRLAELWQSADRVRQQHVGDQVHLRGLIEVSNHCVRLCGYCGLRAENTSVKRYRMSADEVVACAEEAVERDYGTVVLQAGEDPMLSTDFISELIRRIKSSTPLAVTLSLGERSNEELAEWRTAGADRYLLRFETSNRMLYERIHPPRPGERSDRIAILHTLRELDYEVGGGVMIGIPGQTYDDLARDIELFGTLDLDMIGSGPYLVHPDTPLADPKNRPSASDDRQVPCDELTAYKVIALTRLVCPLANIPSTTALAVLDADAGWKFGLTRGANVIMPNVTPSKYRMLYDIYPGKAYTTEHIDVECINAIGRRIGVGRGDSPNYEKAACGLAIHLH